MVTDELMSFTSKQDSDLTGIANVKLYEENISIGHPKNYVEDAKSVIILGVKLIDAVCDSLKGEYDEHSINFHGYLMHYIYNLLDYIAVSTANYIEAEGYKAYPIQSRSLIKKNKIRAGYFSFVQAATLAEMGVIGKNSLLITPQYGQRIRFTAVITNADLSHNVVTNKMSIEDLSCGNCTICIDACPVNAIEYDETNGSPIINKAKCSNWMDYCQCALCQCICPKGRA